jgi:hypothetical protein
MNEHNVLFDSSSSQDVSYLVGDRETDSVNVQSQYDLPLSVKRVHDDQADNKGENSNNDDNVYNEDSNFLV